MLPIFVFQIVYYIESAGDSPFENWFTRLDRVAKAKITVAIARLEQGNTSNVKSVGGGVLEYKLAFGPGYRLYFAMDGKSLIVLLTGGTKQRQSRDIATAKAFWEIYKQSKVRH